MSRSQSHPAPTKDPRFKGLWNRAHNRWRMFQALKAFEGALWFCALTLMIWMGVAIWKSDHLIQSPTMLKVLVGLSGLAVFSAWINWVDPKQLARELDQKFDLKDGSLAALELDENESGVWKSASIELWSKKLEQSKWSQKWPIRPSRWMILSLLCIGALGSALEARYAVAVKTWEDAQAENQALQDRLKAVEKMFQDWEKDLEKNPSEELEKALKDAEPLREKIAENALDEREALLELSRMEEQLAKMAEKMKASSLKPMFGALAEALEPLPEMKPTAQSLKKGAAKTAEERLSEARKKYENGEVKLPGEMERKSLADKLRELAEQMLDKGQRQAAESMSQMAEGLEQGTPREMSEAMESLEESLAREAMMQSIEQSLQAQMGQLQEAKQMVAQGQGEGEEENSTPFLADQIAEEQEKGIGAGIDETPTGDETKSDAERKFETLTGQVGDEGDSQSMTLSANQGNLEQDAAYKVEAFDVYEKMSLQSIGDESMPATHKRMLRQYFQSIRPQTQSAEMEP